MTIARLSLSFLWIVTGFISLGPGAEIGLLVLSKAGIVSDTANGLIIAGSVLDIGLGVWLICNWQRKVCCVAQALVITIYSVLLTLIAADFWWHPFGPLTKNIPILGLIYLLYKSEESDPKVHT